MEYSEDYLIKAHEKSSNHKEEILAKVISGCFYCRKVYPSKEIEEWIDEQNGGETAICPKCNIDSVLSSELPINEENFLLAMNKYFFS